MHRSRSFRRRPGRLGGVGAAAITLASLWDGQTGLMWNAAAAGALWQNRYGLDLAADDAAEPAALILDQKPGAGALGAELRGTGVTANVGAGAGSYDSATGAASLTYTSSGTQGQVRFAGLSTQTWYRIELASVTPNLAGWRTASGTSSVTGFVTGGTSGVLWSYTGASTDIYLAVTSGTVTFTVTSVKPVPGVHGWQDTSTANRPALTVIGGNKALAFDGSNDALSFVPSATLTAGAYTILVAGRYGCWLETGSTTLTAGTTYTLGGGTMVVPGSAQPSILKAVKDVVGVVYISKLLSDAERDYLLRLFQGVGAGGLLGWSAEKVVNGDGTNTAGWTQSARVQAFESLSGVFRITHNGNTGVAYVEQSIATVAGAPYVISGTATRIGTNYTASVVQAANGSGASGVLGTAVNAQTSGVQTSGSQVFLAADADTFAYVALGGQGTAGAYGEFDNISMKQLIPAALLP